MHIRSPFRVGTFGLLFGVLMTVAFAVARATWAAEGAVEAPELRLGDKWVYHNVDGYRQKIAWDEAHEITSIGPDGITVTITIHGPNGSVTRTELWSSAGIVRSGAIYESETDRFDPALIRYQFPISTGATWSQRVRDLNKAKGPYGPITFKGSVRGHERVTTPAGSFDAVKIRYVIQLDDESLAHYPTQCDYVVWYAPEVGAAVREERRSYSRLKGSSSPRVPGQNAVYELISFTRGR